MACDGTGELIGFAKITRDLTEAREAETALRASEEATRAIMESAAQGIVGVAHDGSSFLSVRQSVLPEFASTAMRKEFFC